MNNDILAAIKTLQSSLCGLSQSERLCLIHLTSYTRWRRLEDGPIPVEGGSVVEYNLKNAIDDTVWQVPTKIQQLPTCQESAVLSDSDLDVLLQALISLKKFFPADSKNR